MDNNENGKWITVKGRHVFIKDGESFDDAMARSLNEEKELEETDDSGEEKEIWKDPEVQKEVAMNTAKMFGAKDVTVNGEKIDLNDSAKVVSGDPMEEMAEQRVHDKEQTLYNDKVVLDYMNKEGMSEINGMSKEDLEKQIADKEKYIETARSQSTPKKVRSTNKEVVDKIQQHIRDYYENDEDLVRDMDAGADPRYDVTPWKKGERMVESGNMLIANQDMSDTLNSWGLNPSNKEYDSEKSYNTYKSLVGREMGKIYENYQKKTNNGMDKYY